MPTWAGKSAANGLREQAAGEDWTVGNRHTRLDESAQRDFIDGRTADQPELDQPGAADGGHPFGVWLPLQPVT